MQTTKDRGTAEPPEGSQRADQPASPARLAFASFLMLFVELALIRWVSANNVFVNNATNFVLLASFLGIGIGFLNARAGRDYVRWAPVALLVLVGFVLAFPVVLATLTGPRPFRGLGSMTALPQPASLAIVFVLVVGVMAGLGQAVARTFVRFAPLNAYRLDILGSIAGIVAFSALSFLNQPPAAWGLVAGVGLVLLLLPRARWWQLGAVAGVIALLALEVDSTRLLSSAAMEAARREQVRGPDLAAVAMPESALGLGFTLPTRDRPLGGPGSFGTVGLGGCRAWALPEAALAFAYLPTQLLDASPDPRDEPLTAATLQSLLSTGDGGCKTGDELRRVVREVCSEPSGVWCRNGMPHHGVGP